MSDAAFLSGGEFNAIELTDHISANARQELVPAFSKDAVNQRRNGAIDRHIASQNPPISAGCTSFAKTLCVSARSNPVCRYRIYKGQAR
jgi:hypothetical protein